MADFELDYYVAILRRHLRWAVVLATATVALGLSVAYLIPPVYRASSTILVEAPQIPEDLAKSTVSVGGIDQIRIIEQEMLTTENLAALADQFGVFEDQAEMSDVDVADGMRARMSLNRLPFEGPANSGAAAFALSFDAGKPDLAARVSSALATQVLEENQKRRTELAGDTLEFFKQDEARLRAELAKLQSEILAFKLAHRDALPDSLEFRRNQQAQQQERLLQLQREEAGLRDRRDTLVKTYQDTGLAGAAAGPATPQEQMLADLKNTLLQQQLIYSEQSDSIKLLRAQIAKLEEQIKVDRAAAQNRTANTGAPTEYDLKLAEIDGRLKFIADEGATISQALEKLNASILETPANEEKLGSLTRKYLNTQDQYNTAASRLANASTGEQIELRSKGVRFSIIELARPPQKPMQSKRLALAGASLFGAIGLALAYIILRHLLTSNVRRPVDIERHLQLQPFATIPYIPQPSEVRRARMAFVVAMLGACVLIPLVIAAVDATVLPIESVLSKFSRAAFRG